MCVRRNIANHRRILIESTKIIIRKSYRFDLYYITVFLILNLFYIFFISCIIIQMIFNLGYSLSFLFILCIFLLFYFIKPKLLIKTNFYFLILMFSQIAVIVLDLATQGGKFSEVSYSKTVFTILECIFSAAFLLRPYMLFMFFVSLCKVTFSKSRKFILKLVAVSFGILIIISSVAFIFNLYNRLLVFAIYTFVPCLFCAFSLTVLLTKNKAVSSGGFISSVLCLSALITASLCSGFLNNFSIINLIWIFSIVVFFLTFENPDNHIDSRTGFFIRHAFHTFIFENKRLGTYPYLCGFVIKNYMEKRMIYGETQMDLGLTEIGKCLTKAFPRHKWFYLRDGHFMVVCKNDDDAKKIREFLKDRFSKIWKADSAKLYLNIALIELSPDLKIKSAEHLLDGLRIAFDDAESLLDGETLLIDSKTFDDIERRSKVRKILDSALQNNGIQLYLQPIIDSSSRKIIAAEALSRLYDDELGVISPGEFIKLAEKNGNIETLCEQILNKTCEFIKHNDIEKLGIKWINVNLSPIQCQNSDLADRISSIADKYSVSSKHIHLEVTEESMVDAHILTRQMNTLISYGYDISLDDYGSGFSNIIRVKRFPFNNIKLDMQIVWEHFKEPDNILPSIINVFKERGLSVTAEGVESKDMADALQNMGCTYLQGFYFSKPVPTSEFLTVVKKHNLEVEA